MACLMVTSIIPIVMPLVKTTLIGIKEMIRGKMAKARDRVKIGRRDFGFGKGNYVREFPS